MATRWHRAGAVQAVRACRSRHHAHLARMQTADTPTVYYDGACPLCRREIAHYRAKPGGESVCWVDVSQADASGLGPGLTREAALARMHVRGPDGTLHDGARAFAVLWSHLPGWTWLGRFVGSRPIAPIAEGVYRVFLRVRRLWR